MMLATRYDDCLSLEVNYLFLIAFENTVNLNKKI
jgi:hypothetical protein